MRSILFRFVIAFFIFIIGVAFVYIWFGEFQIQKSDNNLHSNALQEIDLPKDKVATPIDLAEYYGYVRKPSLTCQEFSSVGDAAELLNEKIQSSARIGKAVKREIKLNENGKRVGRRFVIYYCCGEEG